MAATGIRGTQIKDESVESVDIASGSIKAGEMSPQAITGQTAITTVDTTNDMLLIFDATDSALKKVAPTNLGIGGSSSPAGSDKQIQYNNGGAAGGAAGLVYDDSNRRLGIGYIPSDNPQYLLHLSGAADTTVLTLEGNGDVGIRLAGDRNNSGEGNNPYIYFYQDGLSPTSPNNRLFTIALEGDAGATFDGSIANTPYLDSSYGGGTSARSFQIATGNGTDHKARLTIAADGNMGIGTSIPTALLHISSSTPGVLFRIDHPDSGTDNPIFFVTGSAGQSKVGIGTETPDATFAISDDGKVFEVGSAGETSWFEINNGVIYFNQGGGYAISGGDFLGQRFNIAPINATYGALGIGKYPGSSVNIVEVNSDNAISRGDYFVIDSDGKVGISTISPSTLLDVSGSAKANTFVTTPYLTDLGSGTATHLTSSNSVHFLDADSVTFESGKNYHELYLAPGSTNGQHIQLVITGSANNPVKLMGDSGGYKAQGTVSFSGAPANGQTVSFPNVGGGTTYTVTWDASASGGEFSMPSATNVTVGIGGVSSANDFASLMNSAIDLGIQQASWPFTIPGTYAGGTSVTLSQTSAGTSGNQTITENSDNTTVTGFSFGTALIEGTINSTYGIALAGTSDNGNLLQGAHLIYDSNSEKWQVIAGTQLTS